MLSDLIKKENNNIDLIRLFAVILVVWCHSLALTGSETGMVSLMPKSLYSGKLGVSIFFFFSGLLVTNSLISKKKIAPFVLARFFRIVPAYYVLILLSVFLLGPLFTSLSLNEYLSSKNTWNYLLKTITFGEYYVLPGVFSDHVKEAVNGSLWSIPLEVKCYVVLLVMYLLNKKYNVRLWLLISLSLLLAIVPHTTLLQLLGVEYTVFDSISVFCFVVGSICALFKEKITIDLPAVGALSLLALLTWRYDQISGFVYPIALSVTLLYVTSITPFVKYRPRHDVSYGMYLWHWPMMQIVINLLGIRNPYLLFGVSLVLAGSAALASCVWIETPMISLGRRLGKKSAGLNWNKLDNSIVILLLLVAAVVVTKVFF